MVLGFDTGSTAAHSLDRIGDLIHRGELARRHWDPYLTETEAHASAIDIPLNDLGSHPGVFLSINGSNEVDLGLNLVKGRSG
ncbi:hypothetical protein Taro_010325 [Colocasia esculenta]|uniref:Uncharacterized protein n=1 Tax=Colocasia esculenta TaxID=4460 RepID=A0A843U979_COLES|nr:hypothetical protein [Colocasia esculenta]